MLYLILLSCKPFFLLRLMLMHFFFLCCYGLCCGSCDVNYDRCVSTLLLLLLLPLHELGVEEHHPAVHDL
jgi:hypothetical protein